MIPDVEWVTSDLHYGHVNMAEWRGFASVVDMNAAIENDWFSKVGPDDSVLILGDVIMGLRADGLAILSKWPGTKYLMPGNHDHAWSGMSQKYVDRWTPQYGEVFTLLPEQITVGDLTYCHFPYHGDHVDGEPRFPSYRPVDEGKVLLHGHVHSEWTTRDREINVGWDVRDGLWDIDDFNTEVERVRNAIRI